jgi:serine/threonine-protein kinase
VKRYSFGDVGYLRLVASPWANVSVDGRFVGQTPLGSFAVPAGAHSVQFVHPDLGETTRDIDVVSGQTTLVRVQLQQVR